MAEKLGGKNYSFRENIDFIIKLSKCYVRVFFLENVDLLIKLSYCYGRIVWKIIPMYCLNLEGKYWLKKVSYPSVMIE